MPADPTAPPSPARVQAEDLDEESRSRSEGLVKSLKAVRIKREGGSRAGSGSATPVREGSSLNSPANGVSKSVKSEPGSPDATNGEVTDSEERIKDEKVKGEKMDDEKKNGASVVANGKKTPRSPILWLDAPSATTEAKEKFEEISHSIYINKRIGDADQDGEIMTCECKEEWDGTENQACGEDSDCINRVTRMECMIDGCGCGEQCQNTRFQRRQYADVSVIKADKKGFGLRADSFIPENTFIYEYVGEVIDEIRFRKRMDLYDKAGIKHFYFMSLKAGEFIDATKKGGLGRFCNHSCNPNCYVDKWVVGDKLRMGIFAKRDIIKGEELVFDYNVDRYGADPQPCYCGEPNCVGYIGGKTQTDAGPRLSHHVIEALGLEDDSVIIGKPKARKPRKTGEADSEYLAAAPIRQLKEKDVTKVMSTLVHCQERWIVHKLLSRIHNSTDESVYPRVMRLHGYQILGRILHEFKTDDSIITMCLDILMQFPRVTKNKITSSKIEPTVHDLADTSTNQSVQEKASALLQVWSELETAFRIPKRAPTSKPLDGDQSSSGARTPNSNSKSKSRSKSPDRPIPTGPKGYKSTPPTGPNSSSSSPAHGFIPNGPRRVGPPPFPPKPRDLPWGWHRNFCSIQQQTYFWANDGSVTWWKPSMPCDAPKRLKPPPPPIYPYVALEREPLPETIRQMEKAAREKIEAKKREEREKVDRERRERENLERLRKEEEERIKREEAEKEERKKRKEERKEWEKKQRVIKLEEALRKTVTPPPPISLGLYLLIKIG
ncbi:hypothetical protein EX30DRAFT_174826 [Ascodesmis nigricans]|uniref:Histone-lysine N-methyltransferase, H3 lysine-36 specific n=1 Tax=Ascodesmis nigricans TaxID=341454 RepID=A0A4S2MLC1_9PEZI|nr:hypothetical protein EX30DRAFT_174826 [Ascodesmis nigricans]